MDPSSLAKLVAEQAQVIEQLKLERETASQTLKEEILSSLRHDLRPKRRKKKGRKAINRSLEESYSDIEVDYDDDGEEYLDESSLVSSSSKTNSMIVRSSSTNNMTGRSVGRSGLSSTTGRKVIKRAPSSGSASVTTSVTQNRSIDALIESPFNAPVKNQDTTMVLKKNNKLAKTKKKTITLDRDRTVPLSPTSTSPTTTMTQQAEREPSLDASTMRFLQKSAMMVNDATGRDAASIMASTFSKPLPVPKKQSSKKKKKQLQQAMDGAVTSDSLVTTSSSIMNPSSTTVPGSRSITFSATTNEQSEATLPNVTGATSRSPSRVGTGRMSTAGRSSRGGARPRTVGPSSVATVRSEAESLGRKLLGPLNLDGGDTRKAPLPVVLQENEWENELARNILSLYSNQVIQQIKTKREEEAEAGKRKTRKMRRIKELKQQGLQDSEIDEIIRTERFSKKTRTTRSTRKSTRATSSSTILSRAGTAKSASMGDAAASVLDGLLKETEGMLDDDSLPASPSKSRGGTRGGRGARGTKGSSATTTTGISTSPSAKDKVGMTTGEGKIVAPVRPKMIWYGGTGAIRAEWGALVEFTKNDNLRKELESLKEKGRYTTYIATVEGLLAASMRAQADMQTTELMERLYRQMVVTCIAFGVRCLEQKKYPQSLELLEKANDLAGYEDVLAHHIAVELKGFVNDAFAHYYIRRNKPSAALQYITSAIKTHTKRRDYPHVAKCTLHCAYILSKLERHDEAIRCMGQVLSLVDDGLLDVSSSNAQSLLLVAVAYHNIAVEQLILRHVSEACVSSQNARRLARLCLSYSNKFLPLFEATHVAALKELAASVRHKHSDDQHQIFSKLAAGLYS